MINRQHLNWLRKKRNVLHKIPVTIKSLSFLNQQWSPDAQYCQYCDDNELNIVQPYAHTSLTCQVFHYFSSLTECTAGSESCHKSYYVHPVVNVNEVRQQVRRWIDLQLGNWIIWEHMLRRRYQSSGFLELKREGTVIFTLGWGGEEATAAVGPGPEKGDSWDRTVHMAKLTPTAKVFRTDFVCPGPELQLTHSCLACAMRLFTRGSH